MGTTRGQNPDYQITISQPDQGIQIVADMSEEFAYQLSSHYDSPTGLVSEAAGSVGAGGKAISGADIIFKPFTKKTWVGTENITFTLHLLFDALYNSKQDVQDVLTLLGSIVLPGSLAGASFLPQYTVVQEIADAILTPPNPTRISSTNQVDIRIGRMFYWTDIIIASASIMEEMRLEDTGYPIAGAIELHCVSDYVYDKADLANAAGYGTVDAVTQHSNGTRVQRGTGSTGVDKLNQMRAQQ